MALPFLKTWIAQRQGGQASKAAESLRSESLGPVLKLSFVLTEADLASAARAP